MIKYKLKGSDHEDILTCVLENRNLSHDDVENIINPKISEYNGLQLKDMSDAINILNDCLSKGVVCGTVVDPDC